jgi:hypothetical protein
VAACRKPPNGRRIARRAGRGGVLWIRSRRQKPAVCSSPCGQWQPRYVAVCSLGPRGGALESLRSRLDSPNLACPGCSCVLTALGTRVSERSRLASSRLQLSHNARRAVVAAYCCLCQCPIAWQTVVGHWTPVSWRAHSAHVISVLAVFAQRRERNKRIIQ